MKKVIKFPKIGQFRNTVADINRIVSFKGLDENGEPIIDLMAKKPVLKAKGSNKIHGTNFGVTLSNSTGLYAQSRDNIITVQKDNMGAAFFVETNKEWFESTLKQIAQNHNIDLDEFYITMYGEWAGKGIQKTVAISNIEKSLFVFGIKISKPSDENFNSYWIDYTGISNPDIRIYNIKDFPTYEVEIDFNMPQLAQQEFERLTLAVEKQCPVALHFGYDGIGEGIVFEIEYKDIIHRFKCKGDAHSPKSRVTKVASVDVEKVNSIQEFVRLTVTQERFEQAIERVFTNHGEEPNIKKLGDVIRYVVNDITTEEADTLVENNLIPKDVNKYISGDVRNRFIDFLNKLSGL